MNRRGFQIAASTLVVLILGLIIVGGGIYLVAQISGGGGDVVGELTGKQREQLQGLLTQGQLVAVWPSYAEVGGGKDVVVGMAVENRLDEEETFGFVINALDDTGQPADTNGWVFVEPSSVTLDRNERQELPLAIRPAKDAPSGEYTFIVTVTRGSGEIYDSPRSFTLRVR